MLTPLLSGCLQPEAVKVEPMAPVLEKLMDKMAEIEATVALKADERQSTVNNPKGPVETGDKTWISLANIDGPAAIFAYIFGWRVVRRWLERRKKKNGLLS